MEEPVTKDESKKKSAKSTPNSSTLFALVALVAIGVAVYFGTQLQSAKKDPSKLVAADQQKVIDKVGALMELPKDEKPSIATVSDKEKLKEQAFFKSAENGDTLLIYTNAKKAILFRDSSNKVVEVAPIAIDTTATAPAAGTTPAATEPATK